MRARSPLRLTRRQLLAGSVALAASCAAPQPAPVVDPNAHPLSGLKDFSGRLLAPPELTGRVTVLDFWASWCAPCRQSFRHLDQLYRTYVGDGLQVLGVSVDEDPRAGQAFLARARPRFAVGWDAAGTIRARFGVAGLPTTFLLDQEARLVHRQEGFDAGAHRVLESHVRHLLGEV